MSMGYLMGKEAPVVWRGPMVMKAMQQLLHQVEWGDLDVLVLDLPPGTGDTQLTITQQIVLDGKWLTHTPRTFFAAVYKQSWHMLTTLRCDAGSVIITTPHILAVNDAIRGINMLRKVETNVLGLVQNMSLFQCPHCQGSTHVFGTTDRVARACRDLEVPFLGDIPLHPKIGDDADSGRPTVVAEPDSERARVFFQIAEKVMSLVRRRESTFEIPKADGQRE